MSKDQAISVADKDLYGAAFRNYLREDITVALIQNRPLQIDVSLIELDDVVMGDDAWANRISLMLAKLINRCLANVLPLSKRRNGTP